MTLMKGIDDRPKNDDVKRKRPTDGCPTSWRHCRTRHASGSWNRQRNLAGTARSLTGSRHTVTTDVSENPDVCPPRAYACALDSWTCGSPTRENWAVPPPRRWKPRTWVERIQTSWLWFSSASSWMIPRTWNAWKEVESPLPKRVSPRNRPWSLQLSWLLSPPLRPCVDFSERWPWLVPPTPQATSPYKRDRDCLECKVIALR